MQTHGQPEFLTTAEVADYLRLKERTVYELVRTRRIPCSRVTGKLLFPRRLIDLWVAGGVDYAGGELADAPPVVAGSADPLLEWAVRASGSELALLSCGAEVGLQRLAARQAVATGLDLLDAGSGSYNVAALRAAEGLADVVLLAWARREQGLLVAPGNPRRLAGVGDLARPGIRLVRHREGDAGQILLHHLLEQARLRFDSLTIISAPALDSRDVAAAILGGEADAGVAPRALAQQSGLGFVPLCWESFDLAVRRRDYFEPPLQRLLRFAARDAFARRAAALGGYDVSETGLVRHNC
jgi:putative molybdopterin biosynthesis protein